MALENSECKDRESVYDKDEALHPNSIGFECKKDATGSKNAFSNAKH